MIRAYYSMLIEEMRMMKKGNSFILIALAFLAGIMDVVNGSNGFIYILSGLAGSYVFFRLGAAGFRPDGRKAALLLAGNIVFLLLTFKFRLFLWNVGLISCLVWMLLAPVLEKAGHVFNVAMTMACLGVYLCSLFQLDIPLYPVVFFPVYWFGFTVSRMKFKSINGTRGLALGGAAVSALLLGALLYNTLGLQIVESLSYLKFAATGIQAAVYLPLITFFFLCLACSMNLLLYTFTKSFRNTICSQTGLDCGTLTARSGLFTFTGFILFSLCLVFMGEFTLRGTFPAAAKYFLAPQNMYNALFIGSIYLLLVTLLGRGLSSVVLFLVTALVSAANFIKIRYFNEPFYPWDVYLLKSAASIGQHYITVKIAAVLVFAAAAVIMLMIRYRAWIGKTLRPRLTLYVLPAAAILVATNILILSNPKYLNDINIKRSWYIGKAEVLANGFFVQNYFYLTDLDKYLHSQPPDYSQAKMQQIGSSLADAEGKKEQKEVKPNIVVLMSESFWDPTQLNGLSFSRDITQNLKKYRKGEIVSPAVGGSTANTEFEALTGFSMYFMSPGILTYNVYLRRDTPSLASVLKDNGYHTVAIHPNSGWFYNRDKVYRYFGFDEFLDLKAFDLSKDAKGPHVSDDRLVDKILAQLDKGDGPKFVFAISMQNHDPYDNKYTELEVTAKSSKLDETETALMSSYAQGILDADRALGKLIDTLEKSKTPTLVYFFGDHLPRMGSLQGMYDIYSRLNPPEPTDKTKGRLRLYKMPYAAWSNFRETAPLSKPLSPSQITYEVLRDSGVEYPSYFEILNRIRNEFPYLHKQLSSKDLRSELLNDYKLIQYDLMFGKQYLRDKGR